MEDDKSKDDIDREENNRNDYWEPSYEDSKDPSNSINSDDYEDVISAAAEALSMFDDYIDNDGFIDLSDELEYIFNERIKDDDAQINAYISEWLQKLTSMKNIEEVFDSFIDKMYQYYTNGYRHSYYDITLAIINISKMPDDLNLLQSNMDEFLRRVKNSDMDVDLVVKFKKLYDHVMLETVRAIHDAEKMNIIDKAREEYELISQNTEKQNKRLKVVVKKLKEAENGFINHLLSVLGVFSGVIIAFFGGLQYIGSAFSNISSVSKYRLVFITLITGFVMFNTISYMMIILSKMINRPILDNCITKDCSCRKRCGWITRFRKRYSMVFYINVVLVVGISITFGLWAFSNKLVLPLNFK